MNERMSGRERKGNERAEEREGEREKESDWKKEQTIGYVLIR